ncbi:hypothetical protein PoB_001322100 [Plakobranchus ocellatus]|uniref:Uncharacterized protein n=1 Tax=Plakobranchus ocellatus TaxID=259542 RepID=A0AAV3YTI5_9GAST|nr:hypothetical protein PoB_001322100 [Plakobranchus ocellatus]
MRPNHNTLQDATVSVTPLPPHLNVPKPKSYRLYLTVGGTVASDSTLRSAETLLSRVRAPPSANWTDGWP